MPKLEDNKIKISVIIPVYMVANHIRKFAKSLFSQTMTDGVEFIFVNDATPDDSMKIVEAELALVPRLRESVRFISHQENKGLPAARNMGLSVARGEYVIHFDSDDYVDDMILEKLYSAAQKNDLDIVWCDWNQVNHDNSIFVQEPRYDNAEDTLKGMLVGPMHYNVWNKLIRRTLFTEHNISFPEGYSMGEDMTIMMIAACVRKVGKVDGALYNYVKHGSQTITANYTDSHIISLKHNVERVCHFIETRFQNKYHKELAFMKLGIKSVFLVSGLKPRLFKAWKNTFPEANQYIGQNSRTLRRIEMLEWFAVRNMFFFVGLYNLLVVNIYNKLRCR